MEVPQKKFENNWSIKLEVWLRAFVGDPKQLVRNSDICECSSCDYRGFFATARKRHVHAAFKCPNCESRPRDRNIALFFQKNSINCDEKNILHNAPEWRLFRQLKAELGYVGGDI